MRLSKRATSISAAVGAAALGVTLVTLGSGVGAQFTDSATGTAKIAVGTFGCNLTTPSGSGVIISSDGKSATVDLGTITSSAPDQRTAPITVNNTGSIPLVAHWTVQTTGNITGTGDISPVSVSDSPLAATEGETVNIGFQWSQLTSSDLTRSGSAIYTVHCNEASSTFDGTWLFQHDPATAAWNGTDVTLTVPATAPTSAGAGITLLNVSAGSALPAHEPTFVTDTYSSGTPRLDIKLSNGNYMVKYPDGLGAPTGWTLPGYSGDGTWADISAWVSSNNLTVTKAFILADTSASAHGDQTNVISCVNYSGTPLFGSC